ncbi:hypothetical protein CFC21_027964 [Triticum aestivum]|nr:hypothetical protein CFC21_027964 [Triticum aestivum]
MVKEQYCCAFLGIRFFYSIWPLSSASAVSGKSLVSSACRSRRTPATRRSNIYGHQLDVADPAGCTWYTLMRINYTDSVDGDPQTYGVPEVSLLLTAELRQSNNSTYEHMFARKFAPDCLGPLMVIADIVIFKD